MESVGCRTNVPSNKRFLKPEGIDSASPPMKTLIPSRNIKCLMSFFFSSLLKLDSQSKAGSGSSSSSWGVMLTHLLLLQISSVSAH